MHELSICTSIARIVGEHANGSPVARVHLRVGHLRQVVPETLRYSWEVVVDGTPLAGSTLAIEHVPAVIECRSCTSRTQLAAPVFRCGTCGSTDTTTVSGDELLVTSLDLVTTTHSSPPGTE